MSDRPKLGDTFKGQTGLEGRLRRDPAPPRATPDAPEPALTPEGNPSVPARDDRPPVSPRAQPVPRQPTNRAGAVKVAPGGTRIVSVQLDVTIREKLRDFAARQHLTHGGVAVDAIEAHAGELATHWTADQANQGTGLFPTTTRHRVRTQVSAPTQLRMTPEVAQVLDNLVTQWSAPSRSALVNEALRRHLTQHGIP
jgi:hypothetical protein